MNVLHQAGLVVRRKDGKWHFYRLANGAASASAKRALEWALNELKGDPTVRKDARRIRNVRQRNLEELSVCYRS
jgi:hypothetical protein